MDFDKVIPAPEDIDADYAGLLLRRDALNQELRTIEAEDRAVAAEIAAEAGRDARRDQIDSLIRGSSYEPPIAVREKLSKNARRRELINAALHELGILIGERHRTASRKIVETFFPEQRALAEEFYKHLATAVAVHAKFGVLRQRLERAGVDSAGLHDFGRELLGSPGVRNDHASYALREGVRRGYIAESATPEGYL